MVCGKLKSHVFVFCPFSWSVTSLSFLAVAEISGCVFSVLFCLSLVLFFCQVAKNFRLCFFVRLLNFSGSGFFCFFLLSQVVSFFSVFFSLSQSVVFFVRLWFYFFCSLLFFRLWFWFCFLSCVLCSCQAVFSCLVPFVFVRWLNFLGCGLAVFCFSCFSQVVMFCFVLAEMLRLWSLGLFFLSLALLCG